MNFARVKTTQKNRGEAEADDLGQAAGGCPPDFSRSSMREAI
jgi:hypothetical protein